MTTSHMPYGNGPQNRTFKKSFSLCSPPIAFRIGEGMWLIATRAANQGGAVGIFVEAKALPGGGMTAFIWRSNVGPQVEYVVPKGTSDSDVHAFLMALAAIGVTFSVTCGGETWKVRKKSYDGSVNDSDCAIAFQVARDKLLELQSLESDVMPLRSSPQAERSQSGSNHSTPTRNCFPVTPAVSLLDEPESTASFLGIQTVLQDGILTSRAIFPWPAPVEASGKYLHTALEVHERIVDPWMVLARVLLREMEAQRASRLVGIDVTWDASSCCPLVVEVHAANEQYGWGGPGQAPLGIKLSVVRSELANT